MMIILELEIPDTGVTAEKPPPSRIKKNCFIFKNISHFIHNL